MGEVVWIYDKSSMEIRNSRAATESVHYITERLSERGDRGRVRVRILH